MKKLVFSLSQVALVEKSLVRPILPYYGSRTRVSPISFSLIPLRGSLGLR
jgi:hypothetical protein